MRTYNKSHGQLVVLYGRRRIGKSYLIAEFCQDKLKLTFEGIEGGKTPEQIKYLTNQLRSQVDDPILRNVHFENWNDFFNYLVSFIKKTQKKIIISFDEVQWISANQSRFISLFKYFWDHHFKNGPVLIIFCGSVAHFMVKKIIKSKALYGRIDGEILVESLPPQEARLFFKRRGEWEILKYLILFDGVPQYLKELSGREDFNSKIGEMCFQKDGYFINEPEKIFFSQFREHKTYLKIILSLKSQNRTLTEIAKSLKMRSGGGVKIYLENLELAGFIRPYKEIFGNDRKQIKYKLTDAFLRFYYGHIDLLKERIQNNKKINLFEKIIEPSWLPWLGLAFENFCLNHAEDIAEKAKFLDSVLNYGTHYSKEQGVQVDLIYKRTQNIWVICEIKFTQQSINYKIIKEMDLKIAKLPIPKGATVEKMLIAPLGADNQLKESEYFDYIIDMDMLLNDD